MPIQPLHRVPPGEDVYLDANIFVYAALGQSQECIAFLRRLTADVRGYCDAKVMHDVAHKLMLSEAGMNARHLKEQPDVVRSLSRWVRHLEVLRLLPVEWIPVKLSDVDVVAAQALHDGLLCGDALIRVFMDRYGISAIASNDADFARMGLTVYRPTDVSS